MNRQEQALYREEREARIIATFYEEKTLDATGRKYGITRERVRQILKANGIHERYLWVVRKPPISRLAKRKAQLWTYVDIQADPDACWLWTGAVGGSGHYPRFTLKEFTGKEGARVQPIIYRLTKGEPKNWVVNTCRNKMCCNPAHLEDLTPLEAMKYRG